MVESKLTVAGMTATFSAETAGQNGTGRFPKARMEQEKNGRIDEGVSEADVERDLVRGGIFGRTHRSQAASFFAGPAPESHYQKERPPEECVHNADGGEHANTLQSLALESPQQFVKVAVLVGIARYHCRAGYRRYHSIYVFYVT